MDKKQKHVTKNYTPQEKEAFKHILKKYGHTVENKQTDAVSNNTKEIAWTEIATEFNALTVISESRTIPQLKNLWYNMKTQQRRALTKEKQCRLATGGGPEPTTIEIDPDVAAIAPHLMVTAPTFFSSNMSSTEIEDMSENILNAVVDVTSANISSNPLTNDVIVTVDAPVVESMVDLSVTLNNDGEDPSLNQPSQVFMSINHFNDSQHITQNDNPTEDVLASENEYSALLPPRPQHTKMDTPGCSKGKKRKLSSEHENEEDLKCSRIKNLMKQEKDMAEMRKRNEEALNELKMQHMLLLHNIETQIAQARLKEAEAKAELAQLLLDEKKKPGSDNE